LHAQFFGFPVNLDMHSSRRMPIVLGTFTSSSRKFVDLSYLALLFIDVAMNARRCSLSRCKRFRDCIYYKHLLVLRLTGIDHYDQCAFLISNRMQRPNRNHFLWLWIPLISLYLICFVEANQILCSSAHKLLTISRLLRRLFEDGKSDLFYQQKEVRYDWATDWSGCRRALKRAPDHWRSQFFRYS